MGASISFDSTDITVATLTAGGQIPTLSTSYAWAPTNTQSFGVIATISQNIEDQPQTVFPILVYPTDTTDGVPATALCSPFINITSTATTSVLCPVANTLIRPGDVTISFSYTGNFTTVYPTSFAFSVAAVATQTQVITATSTATVTSKSAWSTTTATAYGATSTKTVTSTTTLRFLQCSTGGGSNGEHESGYPSWSSPLPSSKPNKQESSYLPWSSPLPSSQATTTHVKACKANSFDRRRFGPEFGPPDYTFSVGGPGPTINVTDTTTLVITKTKAESVGVLTTTVSGGKTTITITSIATDDQRKVSTISGCPTAWKA